MGSIQRLPARSTPMYWPSSRKFSAVVSWRARATEVGRRLFRRPGARPFLVACVGWSQYFVTQSSHFADWKRTRWRTYFTLRTMRRSFFRSWMTLGASGLLIVACRMVVVLVRTRLDEVVHVHPVVQSMNGIDRPLFEQSVFFSRRGYLIFQCTICILRSIDKPIDRIYDTTLLE